MWLDFQQFVLYACSSLLTAVVSFALRHHICSGLALFAQHFDQPLPPDPSRKCIPELCSALCRIGYFLAHNRLSVFGSGSVGDVFATARHKQTCVAREFHLAILKNHSDPKNIFLGDWGPGTSFGGERA